MRIVETKVYKFDELDEQGKQKAIEWYRDASADDNFWSECVLDDAKAIGKILGINIAKIYYSGFSSQGDGACFEGSYSFSRDSLRKVKQYAPKDIELHRIASGLADLQKNNQRKVNAWITHHGRYYHEMCTDITVGVSDNGQDITSETEETVKDLLRDFMRWIYKHLEFEYEYQNSDAQIIENIRANEYEFYENGKVA